MIYLVSLKRSDVYLTFNIYLLTTNHTVLISKKAQWKTESNLFVSFLEKLSLGFLFSQLSSLE